MGVDDELADVRRLLKETTERAQRAELAAGVHQRSFNVIAEKLSQVDSELELQRRHARELTDELNQVIAAAGDVCEAIGVMRLGPAHEVLREVLPAIEKARALYRERAERILHVFGCAACHGEHRAIWTQALTPPVKRPDLGFQLLEFQRAYVCPTSCDVVLVSNESEETYVHG